MDWQRHLEAEHMMRSNGLGEFTMFWKTERAHAKFGTVNFTLNFNVQLDFWTASFHTNSGKGTRREVKLGAQPIINQFGTAYTYPTQHRAELAVRAAVLKLRNGELPE